MLPSSTKPFTNIYIQPPFYSPEDVFPVPGLKPVGNTYLVRTIFLVTEN